MANLSRAQLQFSKSDFKKATLKANKKLESKNKSLEKSIKDQEKSLKVLEKEYSAESKNLSSLIKDVEFQEERLQKIKGGVYSNEKLLSEKLKKVGVAESELCDYEIGVRKLEEREKKLLDKITQLEFYKSKCSESEVKLKNLQIEKDNVLDDLVSVKNDISKIRTDGESMVANYNQTYNDYEKEIEKRQEFAKKLEENLSDTKDQINIERGRLDNVRVIIEQEKNIADNELQAVKNLSNNTEDKYIEWEQKIAKITAKADKEEARIIKSRKRYEAWRIGVLEEVARMKLKKKVDNIDKAGLSEILNG